jgi:hypothetical protein
VTALKKARWTDLNICVNNSTLFITNKKNITNGHFASIAKDELELENDCLTDSSNKTSTVKRSM